MKKEYIMSLVFLVAIMLGSLLGVFFPSLSGVLSDYTDYMLLILMFLIFLEVPFENLFSSIKNYRSLSLMVMTNFLVIPTIGFLFASLFFSGNSLVMLGVLIYFIAPCTDWFLGFTKVAKGNTALGSILLPINMILQLVLYPVYIFLFMGKNVQVDLSEMFSTLFDWFLIPFVLGVVLHFVFNKIFSDKVNLRVGFAVENLINLVLVVIVLSLFAVNVNTILDNFAIFPVILLAVFLFFITVYFVVEFISKFSNFSYEDFALFSMTTSARNAPMMLGVTMSVFPNEPLVYSALIIGMLIEFPHLSVLSGILLKKKKNFSVVNGGKSVGRSEPEVLDSDSSIV
jgi:ACR3 family arsenite transporter